MRTLIKAGGCEAGVATGAPVIELQWPALSTHVGEISVPVHRNGPNVISATAEYSPDRRLGRRRRRRRRPSG